MDNGIYGGGQEVQTVHPVGGFPLLPIGKIRGVKVGCMLLGACVLNVPHWANPSLFFCVVRSKIMNNREGNETLSI